MYNIDKYAAIRVSLASAETIKSWAHKMNPNDPNSDTYEVLNGNTINYRTQKPDEDGLFCEKIFGPTKNYECKCGHLKGRQYAGTICPNCGVEIAPKEVRRERMSYIKLAEPIVHIWYLKGTPSRISEVLDVPSKQVEEVVLLTSHIVLDKGTCECFENRDVYDEQTAKVKFTAALHDALNKGLIAPGSEDEENANYYLEVLESEPYLDFAGISRLLTKIYGCKFGDGARALQTLLREIDINKEYEACLAKLRACGPKQSQQIDKLKKRLDVLKAFIDSGNKPEDMILTCLPVIPPDLRPMVPLDGSRFASTDLNDLYQKILRRNNSLKALQDKNAPRQMLVNNIRALQDAVNALIDNGRSGKPILSKNGNRVLKSLSASLKGKQGRFRQNLLGKRVDFSGRSVIAVGPDLKMDECGIPREMAVQLFKPFIACKLVEKGYCKNAKQAEALIVQQVKEMWPCLDEVIKEHPVLLNRAPTLHRLGIQAFHPKLVEGRAIRLFPLATTAFNADFDGDMMGVHVPLSNEAIWECEHLMLGSMNILGPKDGTSIVTPTKDMVLGNYYLTLEETSDDFKKQIEEAKKWNDTTKIEKLEQYIKAEGKVFVDKEEAIKAYQTGQIHLHNRIAVKGKGVHNSTFTDYQNESYLMTTVGKLIFNDIFVDGYPYLNDYNKEDQEMYKGGTSDAFFAPKGSNVKQLIINAPKRKPFVKKTLTNIIDSYIKQYGVEVTSEMLNKLKDQGFKFATDSAVTISLFDIVSIDEKEELLREADEKVNNYKEQYEDGILTDSERHKKVVDLWQKTNDELKSKIYSKFMDDPTNSFSVMAASGAGGNKDQLNQLAGMKGNMNKPNGDVIELPIKSSCRDGLSSFEFFISTHGTRKGGSDTALKTAKSGYLTRRLVDVAQSIVVKEEDCGTHKGLLVSDIIETTDGKVIEPLKDRIQGRFLNAPVFDPATGEMLFDRNHLVSEKDADLIVSKGIKEVEIRSLFTCGCKDGVCQKCYGIDLTNGKEVAMGAAVGIIAAQSIGEPGTQLTMRNFNTGGVAGSKDITQGLPRVEELLEDRQPLGEAVISGYNGVIDDIKLDNDIYHVTVKYLEVEKGKQVYKTEVYTGNKLAKYVDKNGKLADPIRDIKKGDTVTSGQKLIEGPIYPKDLARLAGKEKAEQYILKEILKVYRSQEIFISDKHLEIMIKQMFKNVKIIDPAMTDLVRGEKITVSEYERIVAEELAKKNPLPTAFQFVQGITKAALNVESFLSAASFQETTRVLTDAVVKGKTDYLNGIKENVIIGKLIPAGTGLNPDRRFATSEEEKRRL